MAMAVVVVNAILSAIFIIPLAHVGLALATSLGALFNAGLLGTVLVKRKSFQFQPGWFAFLFKLIVALGGMGGVIYYCCPTLEIWFTASIIKRLMMLASIIIGSGCTYLFILWLTGLRTHHILVCATEAE